MKLWVEASWIYEIMKSVLTCFMNLYHNSRSAKVIGCIKNVWIESHFGKMGEKYNTKQPLFLTSFFSIKGKKLINFIFDGISRILDNVVKKIFGFSDFLQFITNKNVKSRLFGIGIVFILMLTYIIGNIKILLIGTVFLVCVFMFTLNYEWMTYVLALYAPIDFLFREYLTGMAGFWDEILMVGMFFVWIYKGIRYRQQENIKQTPLNSCVWVFIGIFGVLLLFSPNFTISIEGLRAIIQYMLWYFLVLQLLKDEKSVKKILLVLVGLVGLLAIHGVYQYIIGIEMPDAWVESSEDIRTRVYSIFSSPNVFGSLNLMVFPIAFSMARISDKKREKSFFLILMIFMLGALVFTYSRGAWIGAACAVGIYVLLKNRKLIIPAILLGILVLLFVPSIGNRFLFMFSDAYLSSSMKGGRLIRWLMALQILKGHPLTGLGLGQFGGAVAMNNNLTTILNGQEISTYYMDNYYLKIAVEAGIIGLIAFIWLMYQIVLVSIRTIGITNDTKMKELETGILAGLIGVICHNLVENVFEVPLMTSLFWMLVAVMMHMWFLNYKKRKDENNVKN
ncbi:O-antigen ligase family protein [Faecalimonas sp.]